MFIIGSTFVYGPLGVALAFSIVFPLILFFGLWLDGMIHEWRISLNPWVENVEEMGFWFNPMFFTWLYFHNKRRYMKWTIGFSLPFVFIFGAVVVGLLTLQTVTLEAFITGFMIGATFTTLLGIAYYQNYGK